MKPPHFTKRAKASINARLHGLQSDDTEKLQRPVDVEANTEIGEDPTPLAWRALADNSEEDERGANDRSKDSHEDSSAHAFRSNEKEMSDRWRRRAS
jgi:hypothetical protein